MVGFRFDVGVFSDFFAEATAQHSRLPPQMLRLCSTGTIAEHTVSVLRGAATATSFC